MSWWVLIGACALMTAVVKGVGPLVLGGRALPGWFAPLVAAMVPALLAALVVTSALADGRRLALGADSAGVLAALVAAWRGAPMLVVVVVAVVVTATLRLLV